MGEFKKCSKCGEVKLLGEFYRDKGKTGGRRSNCKECNKKQKREYKQTEKGKEVNRKAQRKYRQSEKGKEVNRKAQRKFWQTEKGKEVQRKYREKNPNHIKARDAVNDAIKAGRLERPNFCSECGCKCKAEAHHWSYEPEFWLDVQWVCRACHIKKHLNHEKYAESKS